MALALVRNKWVRVRMVEFTASNQIVCLLRGGPDRKLPGILREMKGAQSLVQM